MSERARDPKGRLIERVSAADMIAAHGWTLGETWVMSVKWPRPRLLRNLTRGRVHAAYRLPGRSQLYTATPAQTLPWDAHEVPAP